ncbi:hypothetical protein FE257_002405 [Aspergillus nanangensis]|uniref:Uncharacterized protein n=1 Tax=Aspergillus nanangensis TaxID=2582783 RepID=A0AAD4CCZ5_ASPNN|nr:hypothetical protein FE257_002405 [Aspergillus nanangensis]
MVAKKIDLELDRRPKKNMYVEDVAEFARVLLTITEMTFCYGWQRIQLLFFCQLAAITASRPWALLHLRYRDIALTLIRDLEGGRPRLFIFLKPDFTKSTQSAYLLVEYALSHKELQENFYHWTSTGLPGEALQPLLDGKRQQELKLKNELMDKFLFCQVERQATECRILRAEIDGINGAVPDASQRRDYSSAEYSTSPQHLDIRTFVRHYEVDVDVDVQGIIRKTGSQTSLVRYACSLSTSIDPDRPYKLSSEESKSLNELPVIRARQDTVNLELFQDRAMEAKGRYNKALHELRNEKQRQRNRRIRENLERYRNEQPVIDLERQLASKLIDTKVMGTLEQKG